MTKVFSTLGKDEDGLEFILRANLNQVAGVAKHFTRSEFDAAVTLERGRITSNGAGLYQADEPCTIVGEYGTRRWLIGGSAATSHWRTVEIGSVRIVLTSDSNAVWPTSGAPSSGFGANGDHAFDHATQILYGKTAGSWAQVLVIGGGGGGGGSGLPTQVSYSTVVPLDGDKVMPRTQIAAAVALTIGSKAPGGQCRLSFISDGANTPTMAGAEEWASSFGFDNSGPGLINVLEVWTDDGANVGYAWSQPATQIASDTTAPTISTVTVNGATMVVTYNEPLVATPSASAFTVRNAGGAATQTPSAVSSSGAAVTLTLATPAVNGNTVTLDVSAGAVSDAAGNASLAVTSRAVTNNTAPVDTTAPTISSATVNGSTLTVVWSESLSGTPSASAFSVIGAGGVTQTPATSSQSGATTTLTLTTPAVNGNTVTMNVSAGAASDASGNQSAAVTARAVTNSTPASDTTAPTLSAAAVNGATLTLTYNEALNTTAPATSAYSVVGAGGVTQTPTAVSIVGTVVTLTLGTPAVAGNTVTASYTVPGSNPIRDVAGNSAAALSAQAVTNNTAPGAFFSSLTNMVDEGGGSFAATSAGTTFTAQGVVGGVMAGDGWIEGQKLDTVDTSFYLGLDAVDGAKVYTTCDYLWGVGTSGILAHAQNGSPSNLVTNIGGSAATFVRLRRQGNTLYGEYSTDNKATWQIERTFTNVTTAPLYPSWYTTYSSTPRRLHMPGMQGVA
jgi:uncharacterized repeat protein (TIGR02059 family)